MFEHTKAVVFALDGTIYHGSQIIDGALEAVQHCRELGKSVFFLTNNSSETRLQIFHKLRAMGIDCTFREVLTSGYAAALYAHREKLSHIYVCGSPNLISEFEKLSVHAEEAQEAQNLLIGLDSSFDYERLNEAMGVALRAHKIIACNMDKVYPGQDGEMLPGCGSIVAAIEWCAGRKADYIIGKPNTFMLETICEQASLKPEQILVVGDSYETDILMANKFGCPSLLISSHVYSDTINIEDISKLTHLITKPGSFTTPAL